MAMHRLWVRISFAALAGLWWAGGSNAVAADTNSVTLPEAQHDGGMSVERAIAQRRSVREFSAIPITLRQLGQLLWAAQGITSDDGRRASPSAGALYPLEVYVLAGNVESLAPGVYHYEPVGHRLTRVYGGDARQVLAAAALGQHAIVEAAAVIVLTAVVERTAHKYGRRAERYVDMEAGHAAQNLWLQAVALHLGLVSMGAFDDAEVREALHLPRDQQPLYILPTGHAR